MGDVTNILTAAKQDDPGAKEKLLELVYAELHQMAHGKMKLEAPGHTVQATALVTDAWMRLFGDGKAQFVNRAHFFGAAGEAMRRILIDEARRRRAIKRPQRELAEDIDDHALPAPMPDDELFELDGVLDRFAARHPRQAEVVKLKFFVGMKGREIAEALDISIDKVKDHWAFARAWLKNELKRARRA